MTKSNSRIIRDFVSSTWFGQNYISHNKNLIVAHNILFSYGVPLCVYERHTKYPFKIRNLNGKHKNHIDMLLKEIGRFSNTSWEIFNGKLKVYGNDCDKRRKVLMRDGNPPYET